MSGDAWCKNGHTRTGLVSNQSRHAPLDHKRPLAMLSTCDDPACIAKCIREVAGSTNETATYEPDAE